MTIQKKAQELSLMIVEDTRGVENIAGRVLNYQRQKENARSKGYQSQAPSSTRNYEQQSPTISGETTALFFDRHERLPYDRRSILGWPMTWLERHAINFWSFALSFAAWVLLFSVYRKSRSSTP